jgi:hypothetical protein
MKGMGSKSKALLTRYDFSVCKFSTTGEIGSPRSSPLQSIQPRVYDELTYIQLMHQHDHCILVFIEDIGAGSRHETRSLVVSKERTCTTPRQQVVR